MISLIESLRSIKKLKSAAVVSLGSGSSLAPIIAAKLLRKKVIYVESACRINTRSLCGNIVYKYFADLFIVQWEEQIELYPNAIYAGRPF